MSEGLPDTVAEPIGGQVDTDARSSPFAYPGELPFASPDCPDRSQFGLAAVLLWLNSHRWIHRRAESMTLEDASVGSRILQVSFTVPQDAPTFELNGEEFCCLPISLLRKHKVNLFCLTDGHGNDFPLLTRDIRGDIAAAGLVRLASAFVRAPLGQPLPGDIRKDVECAAQGEPSEAIPAMARMEGTIPVSEPVSIACRALLMGYETFRLVIWSLALNSMILARVPYKPGEYRTLTARYDEPLNEVAPGGGAKRLVRTAARTVGLTPKKLWFPARALPAPSSNHYQVAAPDGLKISAATFAVEHLESPFTPTTSSSALATQPSVQGHIGKFDRWDERDRETGSLSSIHLYDRELPEHSIALMRVNLRPNASGTLRAIWLTAAISVVLLVVTGRALGHLRTGGDGATATQSASALLLLIPTLLAAYVARPGEHTLTSELLFGVRALGLFAGGTTFAGACYLVLTDPSRDLGGNWTVLIVLASIALAVLTVSFLFNRAMAKPEGNPELAEGKLRKWRAQAWISVRRRLG